MHRNTCQLKQRILTGGGSITVRLISSLTCLDSVVSVNTNNGIFSSLVKSNRVKLDFIHTVDPSLFSKCSLVKVTADKHAR